MKRIIAYFIKYPVAVNTILTIISVFGFIAYTKLTSSFFPLVESRMITIQLVYPGAAPEEMEEGVVQLIEEKLQGVSGIERVTSKSKENAAQVSVECEKGYNTSKALEDVQNAVNGINNFPSGLEKPVVFIVENVFFTINYAITGDALDLQTLKSYARRIEKDLLRHEGISKVGLSGFPAQEIEISFDDVALRRHGLTLEQAGLLVRNSNIDITGGSVRTAEEELLIRSRNKGYYAKDIEDLVILRDLQGAVVRLKDIAEVKDRWSDDPNRIYVDGRPGVEITVQSTDREDLLQNAAYTRSYFNEFSRMHPQIKVTLVKDQSETLNERKELLFNNGMVGMILVLLLLSLFLNPRIAFWVAAGIPVSFLGMFIIVLYLGVTINVISLFGMIVVIGILVDDGIVISENIYYHYEMGKSAIRAAIDGTMEVIPAVFSAVITTMVAFSFFFLVDGRAGDFFSELSTVVIATLFVSLIEALIILPAHLAHSKALQQRDVRKNFLERLTDRFMYVLRDRLYAPALRFALNHRFFSVLLVVGLFIITIGGIKGGLIKFTFFPNLERNEIPIDLALPSGIREQVTNERLVAIEQAILKVNEKLKQERKDGIGEIVKIERKLGPNAHEGQVTAILIPSESRNYSSLELANMIRDTLGPMPDAEKLTFGQASAFGKPVSVTLLGDDIREINAAKAELKEAMVAIPELKDVVESVESGRREIHVTLQEKAYALGFTESQVLSQVRAGYFGYEAQRLQRGRDEVKIWVRFNEDQRKSLTDLSDMRIKSTGGGEIPLSELAQLSTKRGVVDVDHLNGQRQVTLEAELRDKNVSAPVIINSIKENIMPGILSKYSGIVPLYEGQNREAVKTQQSSKFALPFVLVSILAIITFTFRSFAQAVIILLLLVPFSFIGVAWGHYIHGQQLSILSFLGVVALIGIIVNDSLVLVSKMNGFLKEGMSFQKAVYESGYVRFRAIFLTSATTVAGLAPLIMERSFQAQFLIPMAISVAYGIGIATVLTLILLPVFLSVWNDMKRRSMWIWNAGELPSAESVEPAIQELKAEREDHE
jgi:multidrug efflux pump subunit AcrB